MINRAVLNCSIQYLVLYIDQDDHFSINYIPGYIYAFTQDGTFAWYGYSANGKHSFSCGQQTQVQDLAIAICEPEVCIDTSWYVSLYGC
jgi:hypothetical protein